MICYTYYQVLDVLYEYIIGAIFMFIIILWYEVATKNGK